jgi:adenosylhomocysteine nucleosidase
VVASRVYSYHSTTGADSGLKARPRAWETAHDLFQLAQELARADDWRKRLPEGAGDPAIAFGPIAAGEMVQYSRRSVEAEWIRQHYHDATAIEMEGAGVAQAGHLNAAPVAIIRGLSDRAGADKTADSDRDLQPRAAANAAAFAVHLAAALIHEREEPPMSHRRAGSGAEYNGTSVNNQSTGQVGIQAGTVTGSTVWMHSTSLPGHSGPASPLDEIRSLLDRDHTRGVVDGETYQAACDELESATAALLEPGETSRKRAVLALKRFRGLVEDATDLAAKTAAAIAMVNGLS